mmetsp:Transcript_122557/g.291326  ORF Transcript_122557/g.291326 Transcript_122557/m.291326 type:complete len:265 (-) Transcript_122557:363-1157(-)
MHWDMIVQIVHRGQSEAAICHAMQWLKHHDPASTGHYGIAKHPHNKTNHGDCNQLCRPQLGNNPLAVGENRHFEQDGDRDTQAHNHVCGVKALLHKQKQELEDMLHSERHGGSAQQPGHHLRLSAHDAHHLPDRGSLRRLVRARRVCRLARLAGHSRELGGGGGGAFVRPLRAEQLAETGHGQAATQHIAHVQEGQVLVCQVQKPAQHRVSDAPGHRAPESQVAIRVLAPETLQRSHGDAPQLAIVVSPRSGVGDHDKAAVRKP